MTEIKELNFSEFHPLDHRPFNARCRGFYGGGRRHIELWWHYQVEIPRKIKRLTRCQFGRHQFAGGEKLIIRGREITVQRCCRWCWADDPDWDYSEKDGS